MSRKRRAIIGTVIAELLLAGIWLYLARLGMADPERVTPDFQVTLGKTMGSAMGGLLGIGLIAFFIAVKADRKE
jgi:hypothetical protein